MPPPGDISMNVIMVRSILDQALELEANETLNIPIKGKGKLASFRTMFYRERKKQILDRGYATDVSIVEVIQQDEEYIAVIGHESTIIWKVKANGAKEEIDICPDTNVGETTDAKRGDKNREKMIRTMVEDSLSKEDILGYFEDLNDSEKALIEMLFEG